ncbi:retrovirus-related pol polyprotein from transposon TNT 1-94 [Tanacetum coccineum]|uniref:Retrovirus-related pol polyprotein from transposon TNT 1-94 n=1 Tax=Tanacetum coccineum TaxID=301880 RepID=A0ABQ5IID2_9ASTR
MEAPSELPMVSLVNKSLKKLKYQLANLDKVVKKRTTSDAITAGAWGFEHTKACFVTEIIPFLKVLKDTFNAFDKTLLDEITKVQTVFNQMEAAVDQCSVDKNAFEIQIKQLSIDNDQLLVENVKKGIDEIETINIEQEHSVAQLLFENENLRKEREHLKSIYKDQFDSIRKTRVQSKEHSLKSKLKKLKGKNVVDNAISKPSATIAPGMFKLDIEPISHRLKNNRDAHEVYIEKAIENTDTLRGFTCPNLPKPSEKLVAVTLMNKDKRVRFAEPVTSSSNITKHTNSLKTKDSDKPLLTSTGVKPTTSASGSKPSGNIKNNRITRPPSSNQKNKVEDHSRKVKSCLNKINFVFEPVSNAHVKHSVRNAKFESIYAICNKCLFDANHDMTFTIVGNRCPLTRITSTKVVPTKETSTKSVATPTQGILVYSRRPKATRPVVSSSKVKIVESKTFDSKEPTQSWGSTISDVPSSSLNNCRLSKLFSGTVIFENDHIAKIMGYEDYQMGNVTISRVYYVEGLGYNLFSVGHFCDSDLVDEVPEFVIKFLKMIQVRLNETVHNIRTNNGTEFFNHTLKAYYEEVGISHETSVARTSQQNGVVETRNHTLVEAARTMLIFSKALLFLWAEAVATACYTQNQSLIQKRHNKTPYELLYD